jgi:hypothetical protein
VTKQQPHHDGDRRRNPQGNEPGRAAVDPLLEEQAIPADDDDCSNERDQVREPPGLPEIVEEVQGGPPLLDDLAVLQRAP